MASRYRFLPRATPPMFLAVLVLAAASACASAGDRWVELHGKRYAVEIADDDESRSLGLMFRDHMPPRSGMLFIHEDEAPRSYWMMNTRIPLDILYFDGDGRLVSMQRDTPPCRSRGRCPSYPSGAPARYVLELNAGEAARLGLAPGDRLEFGPGVPAGAR